MNFYDKLDSILSELDDKGDFFLISEASSPLENLLKYLKSGKKVHNVKAFSKILSNMASGKGDFAKDEYATALEVLGALGEADLEPDSMKAVMRIARDFSENENTPSELRSKFSDVTLNINRKKQKEVLKTGFSKVEKETGKKAKAPPLKLKDEPDEEPSNLGDFLRSDQELKLKDEPEAASIEQPAEPAAQDPRLARPKNPSRHEYEVGAKNVAVVKQSGDTALIRVRGLAADRKSAVYRYMTVDSDALEQVTGDPDLDETNIWRYIKGMYDKDPKSFRRKGVADADSAFSRFEKLQGRQPAKNIDDLVKRVVGETHKDMLLNAYRNYARGNRPPGSMGGVDVTTDLLPVISSLSSDQVAQLMELYPGVRKTRVTPQHVKTYLGVLKRRLSPLESKQFSADLDKIILESDQEFNQHLLSEAGWRDWLKKGMGRLRGEPQTETEKYVRQAYLYDRLVERMVADMPRLAQNLQRVGVDVSKYPELKELAPMHPYEALGQAEPEAQAEPEPQGITHQPTKYQATTPDGELKDAPPEDAGLGDWDAEAGNEELDVSEPKVKIPSAQRPPKNSLAAWLQDQKPGQQPPEDSLAARMQSQEPKKKKNPLQKRHASRLRRLFGGEKKAKPKSQQEDTQYMDPDEFEKVRTQAQVNKLRNIRREHQEEWRKKYAKAIRENIEIEESRLMSNDHAYAALKIYTERCNSLNRSLIKSMYDDELQEQFNRAFNAAKFYHRKYCKLLESAGYFDDVYQYKRNIIEGDLLESLIQLIQCTSDLLNENDDYYLAQSHSALTEMYHRKHIGNKENKGGFIPPSKIF